MKRCLTLLLAFVLLFGFTACNNTSDIGSGEDNDTTTTTITATTEAKTANERYTAFLEGKIGAVDKDGNLVYVRDLLDEGYDNRYAEYEMNGDCFLELLLRTRDGLCILCEKEQTLQVWYSGTVYEKPLNNGAIFYERSGGAPDHTNYAYITLSENGEETERLSFSVYDDQGKKTYFVDDKEVDAAEYQNVYDAVMPKVKDDAILWKSLTAVDLGATKNSFVEGNLLYDLGAQSLDDIETIEFQYKENVADMENRPEITDYEDISVFCHYTYDSDYPKDQWHVILAFPNDSFYVTIGDAQYQLYLHEDGALTIVPNAQSTARTYKAEDGQGFTHDKFQELIQKYR